MKRSLQLYLLMLPLLLGCSLSSCNSTSTWGSDPQENSGTAVTAFSLKANSEVLNNLDSVYFSIDLMNASIFNAQPMPKGTDISALAVSISSDLCSVAELTFINDENEQKTVDYLTSSDAKINFAHGAVTLHLVSYDGTASRDYKIMVNVATEVADSLYWDKMQGGQIVGIDGLTASKTVKVGDKALMLSQDNSGNSAISTFIPAAQTGGGSWNSALVRPTFDVNRPTVSLNVESFAADSNGTLYVVSTDGLLLRSTDGGNSFTTVATGWKTITAPYKDGVLGVSADGKYCAYPASLLANSTEIGSDFPVGGIDGFATITSIWAANPQVFVTGGTTASGSATGSTWAFDGSRWAKLSDKLPARSGYAMANYTICETDTTTWRITTREVLVAFGGIDPNNPDAEPDKTVYISRDMGVNWHEGSELLQLPKYVPFTYGSSLLVFDKTLGVNAVSPMAITPITSWECPYLYLFGGYNLDGTVNTTYWSGVVNHLKVKPLQ